ncbi:MAG: VTT domain-containing protein [Burkholderiaceae bacterium]
MARFFLVAVFLAATIGLPFVFWGDQFEAAFTDGQTVQWLRDIGPYAWLSAIGLLVSDIALPIPSTAVMAGLGILYGPWLGGLIATAGSVLAGVIGYGLCRLFGRPIAVWLAGESMLGYGQGLFERSGGWLVALSRWQPVLPEVVACLAGLSKMRFVPFCVALVCGSAPLGFVFAMIGHRGQNAPVVTLLASALAPFVLWFLMRPLFKRLRSR